MVAIPVGYDQPGVASRIAYHGVGEFIEVNDVTPDSLQACVQRVLNTTSYGDHARSFQKILKDTPGLDIAAEILEEAMRTSSRL